MREARWVVLLFTPHKWSSGPQQITTNREFMPFHDRQDAIEYARSRIVDSYNESRVEAWVAYMEPVEKDEPDE